MKTIRRRRLENKTDYKNRFGLLKSGTPRLVVRKTSRYIIAQIIESDIAQDRIVTGVNSKDLLGKGWPMEKSGSLKSLPAAYLTGLLLSAKAKNAPKNLILDLGMYHNVKKSRLYSLVKGAVDGGLSISHSPEVLPTEEELKKNPALAPLFEKIRKEIKHG